ncbi:hypothetical protein EGW08_001738 [Elysia chlorotica]|uniref:G-protein coupled receptors family 1 profile domain-containing protein n=1 Tax=Elysia chlorotica TaxID=188477 RepID=A0A3S1CEH3_ELYCH|nr:hypothetical protein EGW08_001738 [Elysia chlorotica]
MAAVDYDGRETAWKALIVATIALTLVWNAALFYKIKKAAGGIVAILTGQRGPRHQTLVSLIIGDVFVALFSLVVFARITFENQTFSIIKCREYVLSGAYFSYIMPFVYGVGIVVLALEGILYRRRVRTAPASRSPGALVALAVSTVPWIFGLTIALPLNIVGVDLDSCDFHINIGRARAIVYVCHVLPVAMAIFFTIVNICSSQNLSTSVENQQIPPVASGQPGFTDIALSEQATSPPLHTSPYNGAADGASLHPHPGPPPPHSQSTVPPLCENYQEPNYVPVGLSHTGPSPSHAGQLPPGSITYTQSGEIFLVPPPPSQSLRPYYSLKENGALLATTLAFFVCVYPEALYTLCYAYNRDRPELDELSLVIISDLVFLAVGHPHVCTSFLLVSNWEFGKAKFYVKPLQPFIKVLLYNCLLPW